MFQLMYTFLGLLLLFLLVFSYLDIKYQRISNKLLFFIYFLLNIFIVVFVSLEMIQINLISYIFFNVLYAVFGSILLLKDCWGGADFKVLMLIGTIINIVPTISITFFVFLNIIGFFVSFCMKIFKIKAIPFIPVFFVSLWFSVLFLAIRGVL
jgi:prepilin signal peptidase PulO-like enzyme (type II secretory pathway)